MPHPRTNTDDADRRQYLRLLAGACARNAYDLSLLQWALDIGVDLCAERSVYFDSLVRDERLRRGMDAPVENLLAAQPQRSASQRGTDLLLENLTASQRTQYRTRRHFDVTGGESGKRYRIWRRLHQNVEELDACGRRACIWCFQPTGALVLGDVLLAQKTALELFESDAIRIANSYSEFAANSWPDAARALPTYCGFSMRNQRECAQLTG